MSPVSFREAAAGSSSRPEIVHFDATIRRKEKMHHLAARDYPETAGGKREQTVHHQPVPRPSAVTGTGARKVPSAVSPPAASPAPSPKAAPVAAASAVRDPASAGHAKPQKPPAAAPVLEKSKPPAPEKPQINIAELESLLINFVVEQTGYPAEMVELDADLEADLGIDSIKKAQMLGELAEQLDLQISISEDMSLDDFPTLRHITDYLRNASSGADKASAAIPDAPAVAAGPLNGAHRNGDAHRNGVHAPRTSGHGETTVVNSPSRPIAEAAVPATSPVSTLNIDDLEKFLVNFVVEQTGYPPEMVELDADLEADLGIDSIKKAQLFGELAEQLNIQIQITEDLSLDSFPTLRHVLDGLKSASVTPASTTPASTGDESRTATRTAAADSTASSSGSPSTNGSHRAEHRPPFDAASPTKSRETETIGRVMASPVKDLSESVSTKIALTELNPAELEAFLVNFVVEQTGYPPEMVELDADLEADLGIDSIKKAQLFGELAENLDVQIQVTEEMSLDDYRTLRDVLNLMIRTGN